MPDGEDGRRERSFWGGGEVGLRQRRSQRGVLHADLDRCRARGLIGAASDASSQVAEEVAQQVVADDHRDDESARRQDLVDRTRHDDQQHVADTQHRDPGQERQDLLHELARDKANDKASKHGSEDHQQDVLRHRRAIHRHTRTDQPGGKQRRHEGREQSRNRGHGDRQRDVRLCQVGDHVRGGAARCTTDEDDTDGHCVGKAEHVAQAPTHEGHDQVLGDNTYEHRQRALDDESEVGQRQGQAHAEHDDAERPVNAGGQRLEGRGSNHSDHERCQDQQREDRHGDARAAIFGGKRRGLSCNCV